MLEIVYVSITGLKVKHIWQAPLFWRHAIASMRQAKSADGCLDAQAATIGGIHHTRSVWRDRASMRAFLTAGAHQKAMVIFPSIATGKTLGFETKTIPNWAEVHQLWREKGQDV